ncbi:SDR family oxidoreductase [Pelagibius sp.]|uniref:SDR family oxidoreductase n=1 Tax=Pelagibius sp. TaxID=1931238 RepID=UPI003B50BF79
MADADRVAVITGASSGIGEAVAERLRAGGYRLVLSARQTPNLDRVAKKVEGHVIPLDLAHDQSAPNALLNAALESQGRVDVLINNAGMMVEGAVDEIDPEEVRVMLRLNVEAAILIALRFARAFKSQKSGHIFNISSFAGYKTGAKLAAYNASKFAVEGFTDALRMELVGTGVNAHAVAPGTVATRLYDNWNEEARQYVFSGGALRPRDIAEVVHFVLSQPDGVLIPRVLVVPRDLPV